MSKKPTKASVQKEAIDAIGFRLIQSSILFLDVKGYSQLTEQGMKRFAEHIMPQMAKIAESHGYDYLNTWGDAIVIASQDYKAITSIALEFRDLFRNCDWDEIAITSLSLRISLHSGAMHRGNDIFSERGMISGATVNLAARIEPLVTPGEIWATIDFVQALSRLNTPFKWKSVGFKELPKKAGSEELFVIFRAHETDPTERGKEAAVAVVVKDKLVLLVHRIDSTVPMWQFPAGNLKPEGNPELTAVREVLKETGINCQIVRKISERKHPNSKVYMHYFHAEWVSGEAVNGDSAENDLVEWVSPADALNRFVTDVDVNVRSLLETLK